jgi:hypothetical protein
MKSSQIFVFIFIGFLVALIHGAPTTEGVTDVVSTAAATQAVESTTAESSNTDVPTGESGTTDESVTQASSGTNPPQSTVPGSTGAPPSLLFIIIIRFQKFVLSNSCFMSVL